jgi:HK97 family phage portal protein
MSIIDKFKAATQAARSAWKFSAGNSGGDFMSNWGVGGQWLPGSQYDYKSEAGNLIENSIVAASVAWAVRTFPEPDVVVKQIGAKETKIITSHKVLNLLNDSPNPDEDASHLWAAALCGYMIDGNAYWVKLRGVAGNVVEIRSVPYTQMAPLWKDNGSEFISAYGYYINATRYTIKKEDVIHFRFPVDDPANDRKGYSPLKSLLREVCSDNEAATYGAAIMRNFGVMGMMLTPKDSADTIPEEARERIARLVQQKTTGEHRGEPMVLSGAMDITNLSVSPESMALDKIRRIPEERISAALGIPAVVVGLGAGLDRSTFANMEEAGRQAYEQFLIPTQKAFASTLNRFLMPEFSDTSKEKIAFDYSEVAALQENQDAIAVRVELLYSAGIIDRATALTELGLLSTPADVGVYANQASFGAVSTVDTQATKSKLFADYKKNRIEWERSLGNGKH